MHLRVALSRLAFCRAGPSNERRVYRAALPEHRALTARQIVDSRQDGIGRLVLFQPVVELQDGVFVRRTGKLPVKQRVKYRLPLSLVPTSRITAEVSERAALSPAQTADGRCARRGSTARPTSSAQPKK